MKKEKQLLSHYKLNEENPFLEDSISKIEKNVVRKYRNSSGTSESAILQAVNNDGELVGHTSFIRQVEVDEQQFAKLYLANFSAFFDLKPNALKVFGYILNQLKPNVDEFLFIFNDCLKYTNYKAKTSVFKGLAQLLASNIIARGKTDFLYFINPMVVFNGNRMTFAKTYVKKKKKVKIENPNQTNLFDQIAEIEASQKKN